MHRQYMQNRAELAKSKTFLVMYFIKIQYRSTRLSTTRVSCNTFPSENFENLSNTYAAESRVILQVLTFLKSQDSSKSRTGLMLYEAEYVIYEFASKTVLCLPFHKANPDPRYFMPHPF